MAPIRRASNTTADGEGQLLHSAALPLVLQWCIQSDAKLAFRLASCSSCIHAAMMQHCKGLMAVEFLPRNRPQIDIFAKWLFKYAQLLKCLQLHPASARDSPFVQEPAEEALECDAEQRIAAALQPYQRQIHCKGEQQLGLSLQAFQYEFARRAGLILTTLSPSRLLSLHLSNNTRWMSPTGGHDSDYRIENIANFGRLKSLALCLPSGQLQHIVPALPALSSLTRLDIDSHFHPDQLAQLQQQLPVQLLELKLHAYSAAQYIDVSRQFVCSQQPLLLQHLTSLTKLDVGRVPPGSQLPPRLRVLDCGDCPELQPLLSCKQLQQLRISNSNAPAAELSLLSTLEPALLTVQLKYYGGSAAGAAATGWASLCCLQDLQLVTDHSDLMTTPTLYCLRQLRSLTRLSIGRCYGGPLPLSPREMSSILMGVTALQELELFADPGPHLLVPAAQVNAVPGVAPVALQQLVAAQAGGAADEAAPDDEMQGQQSETPDMLPVTMAIASLPCLVSLKLKASGLNMESVEPLTALTKLTRLTMAGDDFDDAAFLTLAMSLTGLRRISLGGSEHVSDASLVVVAKVLNQLTELKIEHCACFTDGGVRRLSSLQNLKSLLVGGTYISGDAKAMALQSCKHTFGCSASIM